ncbi:MAG: MFS transporter [bacterium]|nr:MFS transporter [bacterium]
MAIVRIGSPISDSLQSHTAQPPHHRKSVWGWALYDVANSAFATTILAVIFNKYYALQVAGGETGIEFNWFGSSFQIPGPTLFTYFVSLSTLLVMIVSPLLGAMADETRRKKSFLLGSTIIGAGCTGMLWWVGEGDWLYGGIWFAIANFGFNAGLTFYDALLKNVSSPKEVGWVSGFGWGVGYLGGGLLLFVNLLMLQPPAWLGITAFRVQDTFLSVSIWWVIFAIPLFLWVREPAEKEHLHVKSIWKESWRRLAHTFHEVKKLRDLVRFLLAYLLFNNGVQTIILMASIYGEAELNMTSSGLILFFLMIQGCGFVGSVTFGKFADRVGDRIVLLSTLVVWGIVCVWTYFIGIFTDPITEFHIIGVLAGLVLGASQSSARSMFARFTPADRSAEFFGFFSVQGRLSTLFGPLVYGTMLWLTGSIRLAILCLLSFFITGGLLLWFVNEKRGEQVARELT